MFIHDNMTIKWEDDGNRYCLHIHQDDMADDPRKNFEPLTTMACWHPNYRIGDDIGRMDPDEFWQDLVRKNVPEEDVNSAAIEGKLSGISISVSRENPNLYDVEVDGQLYEELPKERIVYYVLDELSIQSCQMLLAPYAEWLSIWGYEHSGITISCAQECPYADFWDSGRLGVIIALKSKIASAYELDPNDENAWRQEAVKIMQAEVNEYDQYLTGEVYGFAVFQFVDDGTDDGDWDEIDSCNGYYGSNPLENGMADGVGYHLKEALESGNYEQGEAQRHVCVTWTF